LICGLGILVMVHIRNLESCDVHSFSIGFWTNYLLQVLVCLAKMVILNNVFSQLLESLAMFVQLQDKFLTKTNYLLILCTPNGVTCT
jgi:hypothetical protein